jgi:hypothetical protein
MRLPTSLLSVVDRAHATDIPRAGNKLLEPLVAEDVDADADADPAGLITASGFDNPRMRGTIDRASGFSLLGEPSGT